MHDKFFRNYIKLLGVLLSDPLRHEKEQEKRVVLLVCAHFVILPTTEVSVTSSAVAEEDNSHNILDPDVFHVHRLSTVKMSGSGRMQLVMLYLKHAKICVA